MAATDNKKAHQMVSLNESIDTVAALLPLPFFLLSSASAPRRGDRGRYYCPGNCAVKAALDDCYGTQQVEHSSAEQDGDY
jgi:hypothetical protein